MRLKCRKIIFLQAWRGGNQGRQGCCYCRRGGENVQPIILNLFLLSDSERLWTILFCFMNYTLFLWTVLSFSGLKEDSTEQIFEFYISTTFLSNKYLFKYLSQPIRIITMILCCNNISLIFLQRIYVVHNISPTNTCCTCNSAIYIVTITTPSFSYTLSSPLA